MLMTILAALGGGVLRLLPEVFNLLHKREDNSHELAMLDKQLELQRLKSESDQAVAQINADAAVQAEDTKALSEALDAQMRSLGEHFQLIGNKYVDGVNALVRTFVDVLNALVRPVTTYYFLALFGAYKFALLMTALQQLDKWVAIISVYTMDDAAMLAGILSFWFVGRVFDKARS